MDSNSSFSGDVNSSLAVNTTSAFSNDGQTSSLFVASWSAYFMSVIQWTLFTLGTFGNISVVAVMIWRRSRSQLVTQLFIGSLSIAELLVMFSSAWIQAIQYVENNWRFGQIFCQVQMYFQSVGLNVAICSLAALSIERYDDIILFLF